MPLAAVVPNLAPTIYRVGAAALHPSAQNEHQASVCIGRTNAVSFLTVLAKCSDGQDLRTREVLA